MHAQVSSQLSAGGSPGKLAQYTRILADRGVNIRAIGGSEWDGQGAVAVLVDGDMKESELAELLTARASRASRSTGPRQSCPTSRARSRRPPSDRGRPEHPDDPRRRHARWSRPGQLRLRVEDEADEAGAASATSRSTRAHNNTKAWQAHEDWDATNPNPRPGSREPVTAQRQEGQHAQAGRIPAFDELARPPRGSWHRARGGQDRHDDDGRRRVEAQRTDHVDHQRR